MKNSLYSPLALLLIFCASIFLSSCKEDPDRDKFIAQYSVAETCPSGNFTYNINITASSSSENGVVIGGFGGVDLAVVGTVDDNSITIPNQNLTLNGTALTLDASGTINGNILTMNYTFNSNGVGESCTMTCTKL